MVRLRSLCFLPGDGQPSWNSTSMTFPNSVTNWEYTSQWGTSLIQTTTWRLLNKVCSPRCECCSLDASHATPCSESLVASCWVLGNGLNPEGPELISGFTTGWSYLELLYVFGSQAWLENANHQRHIHGRYVLSPKPQAVCKSPSPNSICILTAMK